MTRPEQKEEEETWLEQFKALYKEKYGIDFTQGQIIPYEGPDFLVNHTFGIEFVELFDESGKATNFYSPAAQESFRKGIVKEAGKYCEGKGVTPIEVKVWFNHIEHLTGAENQKKLGVRLGRLVEKLSHLSSSSTTTLWEPRSNKLKFISQVSIALGGNWLQNHR